MSDNVRIRFGKLREFQERDKVFYIKTPGGKDVRLPKSQATLERAGSLVAAVTLPAWLAKKQGLVGDAVSLEHGNKEQAMSREDWFTLGATMAFLIRGQSAADAIDSAKNVVGRLFGAKGDIW